MLKKINKTVIILNPFLEYSQDRSKKYISYLAHRFGCNVYFYKPLQKIFSKVVKYDYAERFTKVGVNGVNAEILDIIKKERVDYAVWPGSHYHFKSSTFDKMREEGVVVVGFFFDDDRRFDSFTKWWIPHIDYCVTSDAQNIPKYKKLGERVVNGVPMSAGESIDHDWSKPHKEKYDVSFVGNFKGDRKHSIDLLKGNGIDVNVFRKKRGKYLSYEDMIDTFKYSKINLNFSQAFGGKLTQKGRIFEVPLAGGFLMTEYVPGLEKFFKLDKEIVCFRNPKELLDKVNYYLNHDKERQAITKAGWKKATSKYSGTQVLSRVFSEIEKDIKRHKRKKINKQKPKLPLSVRKKISEFYFASGVVLSLENSKNALWKEALDLALTYNPSNKKASYYPFVRFVPMFMRRALIGSLIGVYYSYVYLPGIIKHIKLKHGK